MKKNKDYIILTSEDLKKFNNRILEIKNIISTSKDLRLKLKLTNELLDIKKLLDRYNKQLEREKKWKNISCLL